MRVAFLINNPQQVFHYRQIVPHVPDPVAVIAVDAHTDHQLVETMIRHHLPGCPIEEVPASRLASLDGAYTAIVCHTPALALEFPQRSLVVAQQYSLAKERQQYGIWRAHAHLNLMYGPRATARVSGFSHAVAVGNPLLDPYWRHSRPPRRSFHRHEERPRILYLPTRGDLSSTPTVLPRLRDIDADVTIKLHPHADPATVPDGFRVVGADTDPATLLRDHDGVISDFSGAAHDALYAGLPVVLAGVVDPRSREAHRLSKAELDRSCLAGLAEFWRPGTDLCDTFRIAERRLADPRYHRWVEDTFVNPGTAGQECGAQIVRLLVEGAPEHFGAQQVGALTKRYVSASRRAHLRIEGGELVDGPHLPPAHRTPPRPPRLRLAYRRSRRLLGRSERLRRGVQALRSWGRERLHTAPEPTPGLLPAPTPAARREEMLQLLLPHLRQEHVTLARDHAEEGADVAVLATDRRAVLRALRRAACDRGDLEVRIGVGTRIVDTVALSQLRWVDLLTAEWLEVGSVRERGAYRIGPAGYLVMLFVHYDRSRNRYLCARSRAARTDWTTVFAPEPPDGPTRASVDPTVAPPLSTALPAAGPRRRPAIGPVDVVYTWVDSYDPAWQREHDRYSNGATDEIPSANNNERYIDREELRYSLRSLWMFAPFVRHIYLVTADQRPPWLADHPRVSVVSHRDIFPDPGDLPTFNSHAIESCLHRIPGLSEHFLYFNDDVFLGREVAEGDFFTAAGLAKVRLSPSQFIYRGQPEPGAIPTDWAAYHASRLMERDFGQICDRRLMHAPLVQRRDVFAEIEQRYAQEVRRTRAARFRSRSDVAVPSMLAPFYGIATARAVEWPAVRNEYLYLDTGRALSRYRFDEILRHRPRFFCLNATRYTEVDLVEQERLLQEFLGETFPDAAPWELPPQP